MTSSMQLIVISTEEVWIPSCQLWVQRRHGLPEHIDWSWICVWSCSNHPACPARCLPALCVGNRIVCAHCRFSRVNKNQTAVKPVYWTQSVYMRWQCISHVFYLLLGSNQLSLDSISKLQCAVHGYGLTGWDEFKATAFMPAWGFKMRNTSNDVWSHVTVLAISIRKDSTAGRRSTSGRSAHSPMGFPWVKQVSSAMLGWIKKHIKHIKFGLQTSTYLDLQRSTYQRRANRFTLAAQSHQTLGCWTARG